MERFISLLRNNVFSSVDYGTEYDPSWPNETLLSHIIELSCGRQQLTEIPDLPNIEYLYCSANNLTKLPHMPNIKTLYCGGNQLITFPEYPTLEMLNCNNTSLSSLPELPNLKELYCYCNNLFSDKIDEWRIIWKLKKSLVRIYLIPILFSRWKLTTIRHRLSIEHKEAIICHPKTYYVRELYNENN